MAVRVGSWVGRQSLLKAAYTELRLAWRLIREPRVPWLTQAVPFLVALYIASPLDFLPDVLPFVGELDDLGVLILGVTLFVRLCPSDAEGFHRAALDRGDRYSTMPPSATIIDAEWRRE